MGPALDLALRRHRAAAADLEKEALKQPKLTKKKARAVKYCGFPSRSPCIVFAEDTSRVKLACPCGSVVVERRGLGQVHVHKHVVQELEK